MSEPQNSSNSDFTVSNSGVVMDVQEANAKYLLPAEQQVTKGYKQTEVGLIPEDWSLSLLQNVTERISVGLATSVTQYYRQSGIPIVRNMNIKDGYFDGQDMLFISNEFAKANSTKAAKALDVLTVHTGSNLGQSCVLPESFHNCQTFTTLITTPKYNVLDSNFLCIHMSSAIGRNEMDRLQVGGGKGNLNTGDLKKYRIPVPQIKEQKAISRAILDTDALIEALEQLIAKKRQLKQGTMQELLTGKRRLPGFNGEWEYRQISSFSAFVTKGSTPTTYGFDWQNDGIIFLRSECVSSEGLDLKQAMFISDEAHASLARGEVCSGDILITITGNVGRVVHLADDFGIANINQHIARIRVKDTTVSSKFVFFWLSQPSIRTYFSMITTGQAYPQISLKQVRETLISLPSRKEQIAIAQILSDMDAEITELDTKLTKARAVKQGMMQQLLTGKIRLVVNPKPIIDN